MTNLLQGLEDEALRSLAKPQIDKLVTEWAAHVDPHTGKPHPLINKADVPEIEDSLFKMLGLVLGLLSENQEVKPQT